jgi:hypothetical protein
MSAQFFLNAKKDAKPTHGIYKTTKTTSGSCY